MGEDGRLLLGGARFVDGVYTPTVKEAPAA
jgi:hypothetical protein